MPIDFSSFLVFDLSAFVTSFVLLFSVYDAIGTVPVFLLALKRTSRAQETDREGLGRHHHHRDSPWASRKSVHERP